MCLFFSSYPMEQVHEDVKTAIAGAAHICRAFIALCCPIPLLCGATLEDVRYLCPLHAYKAQISCDLGAVGRIFLERVRETIWTTRVEKFEKYLAASMLHGPAMETLTTFFSGALKDPNVKEDGYWNSDIKASFVSYTKQIKNWMPPTLQQGATADIDFFVVKTAVASWKAWEQEHMSQKEASSDKILQVRIINDALTYVNTETGLATQRAITARLGTLRSQSAETLFQETLAECEQNPSFQCIRNLLKALTSKPELLSTQESNVKVVMGIVVRWLHDNRAGALTPPDVKSLAELFEIVVASPAFDTFRAWATFLVSEHRLDELAIQSKEACGAARGDGAGPAEMQRAKAAIESLSAGIGSFRSLGTPPQNLTGHDAVMFKEWAAEVVDQMSRATLSFLHTDVVWLVSDKVEKLAASAKKLEQICRGGNYGALWFAPLQDGEDILECWGRTLAKVNVSQITAHSCAVLSDPSHIVSCVVLHVVYHLI